MTGSNKYHQSSHALLNLIAEKVINAATAILSTILQITTHLICFPSFYEFVFYRIQSEFSRNSSDFFSSSSEIVSSYLCIVFALLRYNYFAEHLVKEVLRESALLKDLVHSSV